MPWIEHDIPDPHGRRVIVTGPSCLSRGCPQVVSRSARAQRQADDRKLWQVSESLTGVRPIP